MSTPEKIPGPDHPISIQQDDHRVVVRVAGLVVADLKNALKLQEAKYPAVLYIPRNDVDMTQLQSTDHTTCCPYKGDCSYFSIPSGGSKSITISPSTPAELIRSKSATRSRQRVAAMNFLCEAPSNSP
jgi:uncharacterized protein (DUF427 family)